MTNLRTMVGAAAVALGALNAHAALAWTVEAQYHFDEPNGSTVAADATGHGHNGADTGDVVEGAPGYLGTAYRFNATGSNGQVKVTNVASLKPGSQKIRLGVRFKGGFVPVQPIDEDVVKYGSSTDPNHSSVKMEIIWTGQALCGFSDSSGVHYDLTAGPVLTDAVFHLIQCYKYADHTELWTDGVLRGTHTISIGSITPTRDMFIGSAGSSNDPTKGTIDEVGYSFE
jgi:hypothetical protein